jgi:hypothetical protein
LSDASHTCRPSLLPFFSVSLDIDVDELRVNWHFPDTQHNKKLVIFWSLLNVFQKFEVCVLCSFLVPQPRESKVDIPKSKRCSLVTSITALCSCS